MMKTREDVFLEKLADLLKANRAAAPDGVGELAPGQSDPPDRTAAGRAVAAGRSQPAVAANPRRARYP